MANNPLNIRYADTNDWLGQVGNANGFVDFADDSYSYRAADALIQGYGSKRGATTLRDVISIYAPPTENDTDNYINFVSNRTNLNPDVSLDLNDPVLRTNILSAMAMMESGVRITPQEVAAKIASADGNLPTGDNLSAVFDSVFGTGANTEPDRIPPNQGFNIIDGPQLPVGASITAQPGEIIELEQARPYSLGEAFSRGVSSGGVGMRSSFNYFDSAD